MMATGTLMPSRPVGSGDQGDNIPPPKAGNLPLDHEIQLIAPALGRVLLHTMAPIEAIPLMMTCSILVQSVNIIYLRRTLNWRGKSRLRPRRRQSQ